MVDELQKPGVKCSSTNAEILATAALFEGDFSIDWLVELAGCKASKIIRILEEEVRKNKLVHRGAGIYCFPEPLSRDKRSACLTDTERQVKHREISRLLIKELPEDTAKAPTVSWHLLHLTNNVDDCVYLVQAGDAFTSKYRTQQAFQCYEKALEDLGCFRGKKVDQLYTATAIKYSRYSTARQDTQKVIEILKKALKKAKNLKELSSEALLEMHLAKNEWLMGRYSHAMKHFDCGWSLASNSDDASLQRSATTFGAFFLYWQGRFREAVESYEVYVSDVEKYPRGGFPLLATITLGYCYSQIGQVTQGLGMIDAVRAICLEREDLNLAAYTAGNMGCIMADISKFDDAISQIKISEKEASEANNNWVRITGYLVLAYSHYQKGEKKKSLRYFRDFLGQREELQTVVNLYPYLLELLWLMEQGKLGGIKGVSLEQELKRTLKSENLFMKGVAFRYQALLAKLRNKSLQVITEMLEQSDNLLEESGHHLQLAETRLELARIHLQSGKREPAEKIVKSIAPLVAPCTDYTLPDDLKHLIEDQPINEQLYKEILHLGQKVADVVYSKDLLNRVLTSVNKMTGAERCALFLIENHGGKQKFRLRASKNITQAQINHPDFSSSMKLLEQVVDSGKGMILEASEDDETLFFSNEKIRSRISVPMILRGKVIGVLYNDNRLLSSAFKESDLDLLAFFAAQAAFALDNARAYNEIKQLNHRLSQEKEYYKEEHSQSIRSNDIIGKSPAILKVLNQVEQVAQTEATALILGQTGVGKELIAREIHNMSVRKDKPFIRVHCAALPENLIPSELFGHEKGAFTGAVTRRIGRFELANGGTLFLDEIGDIPPDIQVRLLRVLQTREFERVGGTETLHSDFRLITATNKDLENEVKQNRFRADLFYRLNVFPILVPDLCQRREDIPLLAQYFIETYARKMRKTFDGISEAEIQKLMAYDWPGNVRELENVIERGTIMSNGRHFHAPELHSTGDNTGQFPENLKMKEVEKKHILFVLNSTGWKIRGPGGAAELLDIHPSTLHFRMKKLGIQRDS